MTIDYSTLEKIPVHLAIIMDGNGRWAEQRMLKRVDGHRRGVETARMVVDQSRQAGIRFLTLYAFSSENWSRPRLEVRALMGLLKRFVRSETAWMMKHRVRFKIIGNRTDLPDDVNAVLDEAITVTSANTGMVLTLALSYGARQEIALAARSLARDVVSGKLSPEDITEARFGATLDTADLPDPDFLIRTSGEMRISNFLLWQTAYTEMYFTDINWPDFTMTEFYKALCDYQARERRFGMTSAQLSKRN